MEILMLINFYIKYVYYLLIVIYFILFIKILVELKPLKKTIYNIQENANHTKELIEETKEKIERIKYTLNNSIPFFSNLFFLLIVVISAIKDYRDTRLTRRSIVKSASKQYGYIQNRLNYHPNPIIQKEIISRIIKKTVL